MPLSSFVAALRPPARPAGGLALRIGRWAWRIALGLMLAAWVGGLAVWLTLHWWILPRLDEWRPQLAAQASRALGHPVSLGPVTVRSSGWVPALELRDVVLRDARGREALRLPQVSAALSVPALLALKLRFEQLLIENARLEVRRDAAGRWLIAGMDVDVDRADTAMEGGAAADWFFDQHEFVIRGGTLRWVDEQRGAPPLQLADVQLVVRNRGRRHELRLDATPPPEWGDRFTLAAQARSALLARPGDWQRWKGTLFASLPRADVALLRRHVDLPAHVAQGEAALRAWIDWDRGAVQAATVDAALRDVSVRLQRDLAPVALATLGGRLVAERRADGMRVAAEGLAFTTADGAAWAPSALALQWRQAPAPAGAAASAPPVVLGGEFSADRLDLATLAGLAERLPIGAGVRALLARLDPEGTVRALQARWDGPLDAPRRYAVHASVQGLSIAAGAVPEPGAVGRPGWRGADLTLDATEAGGQAGLAITGGEAEFPGVFDQPRVPLDHFAAQLQWRIDPPAAGAVLPRVELKVSNARLDNADARATLAATWRSGPGTGFGKGGRWPGVLELSGTLSEGRAASVARYLPLDIDADVRHWVQHAVRGGELRDVAFRVRGDLWEFPYVNHRDGEFRIAGRLQDVTLQPMPADAGAESPWPAFTGVHGELVFDRNAMDFQHVRGRLWGVDLADVSGRIRELSSHAMLEIDGQAHGPAADLLRYVRATPLAEWTGHVLDAAAATGSAELKLGLNLPLTRPADTAVRAALQLPGNDLRLAPALPLLANARGRVEVTHKGVTIAGLRGTLLGGEATIDGGTQADGSQRVTVAGSATADALRRIAEGGPAARLAARLQGQAAYRLQATSQRGQTEWQLTSPLAGLAIDLPEPLRKGADTALPLRLSHAPEPARFGAGPREWWRLELGPLRAAALVDSQAADPRPVRSALAWDAPLPEPAAGGRAVAALPRLDVDAWRAALAALAPPAAGPSTGAGTGAASGAANAAAAAATDALLSAWLPQSITLRTPELRAAGRRLSGVSLDLQRLAGSGDEGWRAQVGAEQVAGSVEYREPRRPGGEARVRARLARLALPRGEAETLGDSMAGLLDRAPTAVPALDIEIDDFELRGHRLGRLVVEAGQRAAAAAGATGAGVAGGGNGADEPGPRSEWRLNRLLLANPDARLEAGGRWLAAAAGARRRMSLDFTLDVTDGGALLERLGFGRVVRGAKGRLKGQLGWDGSPLDLDLPTLGGTVTLALEGGQFLQVDPGAARLLGVLSLRALPRRLALDFRDVFEQGFAFDSLAGDLRIARGVASTDNLFLRGVQALVLMEGQADVVRETQDLHVLVLPELNAGSASLAYAAVHPAIGLGAFLGQWLLREPLRQASAREFRISGPWDEPRVERIERKLLAPLPAAAARAAATAAPAASAVSPAPANSGALPAPAAPSALPSTPAAPPADPASEPR